MNKTLSKVLSLLLVMALVIGMMPMALAAGDNETELDTPTGDTSTDDTTGGDTTGGDTTGGTGNAGGDNETELDPSDPDTGDDDDSGDTGVDGGDDNTGDDTGDDENKDDEEPKNLYISVSDKIIAVGKTVNVSPTLKNRPEGDTVAPRFRFTVISGTNYVEAAEQSNATGVAGLQFTGKASGTATVQVQCLSHSDVPTTTFTITVSAGSITCATHSEEAIYGATHQLTASYSTDSSVTFVYSAGSKIGNVSVTTDGLVKLGDSDPAVIVVNIDALKDNVVVAEATTYVSFYVSHNSINVTMEDGSRTLTFGDKNDIEETGRLDSMMTEDYDLSDAYSINHAVHMTTLSSNEGKLSTTQTTCGSLSKVYFTAGTYGRARFDYTITPGSAYGNMPLCQGYVTINYGETSGDIEYTTTNDKSVTFTERDFNEFWEDSDADGDLDYVRFTSLQPTYGKLYSRTTTTAAYLAQTTDKFYYGSQSSSSYKDLGSVTYVPAATRTTAYDVSIPFTAFGEDSTETASGYVVIHVGGSDNDITSRGIFFGTEYDTKNDKTYADLIADKFEDKTDEDLEYVIFELPSIKKARLFSYVPTDYSGNTMVSQGTPLTYNTKLYYDTNSTLKNTLEGTALIPVAGFSGTITLEYTAYSEDGDEKMDGEISFNVTAKTRSAVFSDVGTNYSWAADSVDFLYYEGTAQGSNNKYNPGANITRGDFMLMLYRAFLAEDYADYTVTSNFSDVVKGTSTYSQETYHAVGVAKALGISNGTNGKYNPKANITREEAMTLIYRMMDKMSRDLDYTSGVSASSFSDYSKVSSYAKTAISDLVSNGVIVGSNNKVNPQSPITRAEMACILHRVITY